MSGLFARFRVRWSEERHAWTASSTSSPQASFWAAALRIATPLIFGMLGALLCERAGVLNLGIEGIFIAGAMAGWLAVYLGAPLWTGVAVAALTGAAFGLLHALLTVPLGLSQHVTGIGITLLATSAGLFHLSRRAARTSRRRRASSRSARWPSRACRDLPFLGPALFAADAAHLLAFALVRARRLRALPHAARPRGPRGRREPGGRGGAGPRASSALRIGAVVAGSALMALGGAFLTMSAFNAFFFEMINGRGWICIALAVFASWRPGKALLGALLFGAFDAFQVRLQQRVGGVVPSQVFLMLPYLLSILALVAGRAPGRLSQGADDPYFKGQR